MSKKVKQVSALELKGMLSEEDNFILLDVREPEEFEICQIEGALLVPLSEFEDHIDDFDPQREYVVHCKSGQRSLKAIEKMKERGFENCLNLEGGIIGWADKVEPTMEKY